MKTLIFALIFLISLSLYSQWEPCNNGLFNKKITSLDISGNNIIAGTFGDGIFLSSDEGKSWIHKYPKISGPEVYIYDPFITCIASFGKYIIVGNGDGVIISTDYGDNWELKNICTIFKDALTFSLISNTFSSDFELFVGTKFNGIFFTSDKGYSWTPKNNGLRSGLNISSIISRENKHFTIEDNSIFASSDSGNSWKETSLTYNSIKNLGMCLAVFNNNVLAGMLNNGIFVSSDDGDTWIEMNIGLTLPSTIYTIYSFNKYVLISIYNYGLYVSVDGCKNWVEKNLNLSSKNITAIMASNNYFYVATFDNGVFRIKKDEITGVQEIKYNEMIILSPNPATDFLGISVGASGVSPENIEIFSVLGTRLLSTPVNLTPTLSMLGEGVRIDVSSLPQGIYFVKVGDKVGKFVKF